MKINTVNSLCLLIIIILSCSVLQPLYLACTSMFYGVRDGWSDTRQIENTIEVPSTAIDVAFNPEHEILFTPADTITFSKGDQYTQPMQMVMTRATVMVPDNLYPQGYIIFSIFLNLAILMLLVALIVELIKFIHHINKGEYFQLRNYRHLLRFGLYLLFIALLQLVVGFADDYVFSTLHFELSGYKLSTYWMIPWSNLLIGLISLLFAKIWKKAIQLKEEQELTI